MAFIAMGFKPFAIKANKRKQKSPKEIHLPDFFSFLAFQLLPFGF